MKPANSVNPRLRSKHRSAAIVWIVASAAAAGLAAAAVACTERSERPSPRTPPPPAVVVVAPPPRSAPDAGSGVAPLANPGGLDGKPTSVAYLGDGTLVIATDKEIVTVDRAGTMNRKTTAGRTAVVESTRASGAGLVLHGNDDIVLLETPSLRELFAGKGAALPTSVAAVATLDEPPSVLLQVEGKLARLAVPKSKDGKTIRVDNVQIVVGGKRAIVTWLPDESVDAEAALFDVATGRVVGRALPTPAFSMRPVSTIKGTTQYGAEKGSVVVLDLSTGAVVRSAKVACPKDSFIGNPMINDAGDTLLVTCGADGITLDPRTLAVKRRFSRILPGCDNGEVLPASYDPQSRNELVIEGCGGEARLDLTTGKYRCSDDIGLVGAPYELVPSPMGHSRQVPAGRENLPHCTKESDQTRPYQVGHTGRYTMAENVVHGSGPAPVTIKLEEHAQPPSFTADDGQMAYIVDDRVVVRSLPTGAVVREITLR